ncbi:hypothetical protein [Capsulimonas corticalis]|nr:hypothetical protein [Capsulimonas corticalis]
MTPSLFSVSSIPLLTSPSMARLIVVDDRMPVRRFNSWWLRHA